MDNIEPENIVIGLIIYMLLIGFFTALCGINKNSKPFQSLLIHSLNIRKIDMPKEVFTIVTPKFGINQTVLVTKSFGNDSEHSNPICELIQLQENNNLIFVVDNVSYDKRNKVFRYVVSNSILELCDIRENWLEPTVNN